MDWEHVVTSNSETCFEMASPPHDSSRALCPYLAGGSTFR